MINRFLSLFTKKSVNTAHIASTELEAELQSTRMQLRESEQRAARLNALLEAQRAGETQAVSAAMERQVEEWMRTLAAPATQLKMQAHLFFEQGKPVQSVDALNVAKRLVAVLEEAGLQFEGQPGETARFDPDRHLPLSNAANIQIGDFVAIRIPGASFHGAILARAAVEKQGENK